MPCFKREGNCVGPRVENSEFKIANEETDVVSLVPYFASRQSPVAIPDSPSVVSCNDLIVAPGYEQLLRGNGLDSLDALFSTNRGELLSKPGLAGWCERIRLTLAPDGEPGRDSRSRKPQAPLPPLPSKGKVALPSEGKGALGRGARGEGQTLYLKRFSDPPASVRRQVRRSGTGAASVAAMEWTWARRLAGDRIPCVKPVAYGEELNRGRERRSAILLASVPGASLEDWVERAIRSDRRSIRGVLAPLATLVARLHGCGYFHRDLYLSHVFFDPDSPDQPLHLIDLQRVVAPHRWRRRWVVKDLAALNMSAPIGLVSAADRIRWLKHYLGVSKLDAAAKCLAYRVVGKTSSIARHERRRRARLGAV